MSKSKNNGIDPQAQIDLYGADTARLFTMFASPPEQTLEWSGAGVEGANRFLRKVWAKCSELHDAQVFSAAPSQDFSAASEDIRQFRFDIHSTLKQADADYQRIQYNTIVSATMKLLNTITACELRAEPLRHAALIEAVGILLRVLYPIAPHITFALWNDLGYKDRFGDLLDAPWPQVDTAALEQTEITIMIQVNGKLRGNITVAKDASKAQIEAVALAHDQVQKFLTGTPKKIIVVPGKLVNIVV